MRIVACAALLMLLSPGLVAAQHAYTVTLTDDQVAVLEEQARVLNAQRGKNAPARTAQQLLDSAVSGIVSGWESGQLTLATVKPWNTRSAHEKRVACRRDKIEPCPR